MGPHRCTLFFQEMAKKMQEKEKERYERKIRERELVKDQKRVEQQLHIQTQELEGMLSECKVEQGQFVTNIAQMFWRVFKYLLNV